jgi:hypothetical protein
VFNRNEEKQTFEKKIQKKEKILLDFFLSHSTHKKFSLEKRVKRELSIYTHIYIYIYIYKRERREAVSALAAAREVVALFSLSSEISFLSSVSFLWCALLTREFPFFFLVL